MPGPDATREPPGRPALRWLVVAAALAIAAGLLARWIATPLAAARIRGLAGAHGLTATWHRLEAGLPARVRVDSLILATAGGDTALTVARGTIALAPWNLAIGGPVVRAVRLDGVRVARGGRFVDPDTLAPPAPATPDAGPADPRVRRLAEGLLRLLLLPARDAPRIAMSDVELVTTERVPRGRGRARPAAVVVQAGRIEGLELARQGDRVRLTASGRIGSPEGGTPFWIDAAYATDDSLVGDGAFALPAEGPPETLRVTVAGVLAQDRRRGAVELRHGSRMSFGALPLELGARFARPGPTLRFSLAADHVTSRRVHEAVPRVILGPLARVSTTGAFDYRLALDLDMLRPGDTQLLADVVPNGLALDAQGTRLGLMGLDQPFTATIHLPRGRRVARVLSSENPHFRTLDRIDSLLVHAVVTNEDGGFFRHRGFNVDAMEEALAENLRAGSFRRGAGTITMQVARNLFLGHERTLSRKAQEVVLAWILEHLARVPKRRLLEIYLNIIEWGPEVHGADEAARYFFDRDAGRLSIDEALFLATVVPAPSKWRYRFDAFGELRRFARDQMHFIGRAMIRKGWLRPEDLPAAEALRVDLRGAARDRVHPTPAEAVEDTLGWARGADTPAGAATWTPPGTRH